MKLDPIRQADIERRLANLAKAARCGAKTRAVTLPAGGRKGTKPMPYARRSQRLRRPPRKPQRQFQARAFHGRGQSDPKGYASKGPGD